MKVHPHTAVDARWPETMLLHRHARRGGELRDAAVGCHKQWLAMSAMGDDRSGAGRRPAFPRDDAR